MRTPMNIEERFWAKVEKGAGCWEWKAALNRGGYGIFRRMGRMQIASRVAFEFTYGRLKKWALHKCDNRKCVRPAHLYEGDAFDNMRDAVARKGLWQTRVTHCPRGHIYDKANCRIYMELRHCRTCDNDRHRKEYWADPNKARARCRKYNPMRKP